MDNEMLNKLKAWVNENYNQYSTGWTSERSRGNYDDCFDDGCASATSWAAYTVGGIIGMELEEPDEQEYED